ncbi:uncharacterized protein RCO7_05097 [Rhynchosporium graminicola]|uniref:Peptidase A1 domain-containing protein n=1 Tax=Rhynchosporium graminicola TaxID=2792576 RepID=A0A1E1KDD1_9HELO|nr:uncharacterized protein RCO7_05097 [Rhynchosporium commune]
MRNQTSFFAVIVVLPAPRRPGSTQCWFSPRERHELADPHGRPATLETRGQLPRLGHPNFRPQVVSLYSEAPTRATTNSQRHNTSFSLKQIQNPKWKPRNTSTTAVYAAEFLKHKFRMPKDLRQAWEELKPHDDPSKNYSTYPRVSGQLVRYRDGQYVFPVTIGYPKQVLNLIFDTASGDFWMWFWLMPVEMLYNGSGSTEAALWEGQSWGATYAVGSNYGTVWSDIVCIDAIGVSGNPIECSQRVSNCSCIHGFPCQWGMGIIDFGFIDEKKYIGSIAYTPITIIPGGGAFWAFIWTGFSIRSDKFNRTNIQVMTDTGGNISMFPQSIANRYYKLLVGSYKQTDGAWIFPCKATLPNFVFGVGTSRIVVQGKNFILTNLPDGVNCIGGIQIHDYGKMRMGFAKRTRL